MPSDEPQSDYDDNEGRTAGDETCLMVDVSGVMDPDQEEEEEQLNQPDNNSLKVAIAVAA